MNRPTFTFFKMVFCTACGEVCSEHVHFLKKPEYQGLIDEISLRHTCPERRDLVKLGSQICCNHFVKGHPQRMKDPRKWIRTDVMGYEEFQDSTRKNNVEEKKKQLQIEKQRQEKKMIKKLEAEKRKNKESYQHFFDENGCSKASLTRASRELLKLIEQDPLLALKGDLHSLWM